MTKDSQYLDRLFDPEQLHEGVKLDGFTRTQAEKFYVDMWIIRRAEEVISDGMTSGLIKCPCHLGIGQEAVAVGISAHLSGKTDRVYGAHRSHSHFLALGGSPLSLFAEVLGRSTGCSGGNGGSMHLYDESIGFFGSVPIVGASIPIAVGAGLALKLQKTGGIAISYFGDGACEEGVFHESMNLASVMGLPVLFVCENNLFSSHLHISLRQPDRSTARFAEAHRIENIVIDGNDVAGVSSAVGDLVASMREGSGPKFVECITYRWKGHVGPRDDQDVGVFRGKELDQWKQRDPIRRQGDGLVTAYGLTTSDLRTLEQQANTIVQSAWMEALSAPAVDPSRLLEMVYGK